MLRRLPWNPALAVESAGKCCDRCAQPYKGFGSTCGPCRASAIPESAQSEWHSTLPSSCPALDPPPPREMMSIQMSIHTEASDGAAHLFSRNGWMTRQPELCPERDLQSTPLRNASRPCQTDALTATALANRASQPTSRRVFALRATEIDILRLLIRA